MPVLSCLTSVTILYSVQWGKELSSLHPQIQWLAHSSQGPEFLPFQSDLGLRTSETDFWVQVTALLIPPSLYWLFLMD